jgi:hypothetical protein
VLASAGGRKHALRCTVAARQEFAGYWEYMLDEAIFTAPAHPSWGGAGLIGGNGELLGIGSLVMQQQDGKGPARGPQHGGAGRLLPPILEDLLASAAPTARRGPGSASTPRRTRKGVASARSRATARRRRPACRKATGSWPWPARA